MTNVVTSFHRRYLDEYRLFILVYLVLWAVMQNVLYIPDGEL